MTKKTVLFIIIPFLLILAILAYLYFFLNGPGSTVTPVVTSGQPTPQAFTPFSRPNASTTAENTPNPIDNFPTPTPYVQPGSPIPTLRLLSNSPVGGYGASTTIKLIPIDMGTTTAGKKLKQQYKTIYKTAVRWVDRGRGNIYETLSDSLEIKTISNTILPRVYETVWNKSLTAFIASMTGNESETPSTVYAGLKAQLVPEVSTSSPASNSNLTPFELKGRSLPESLLAYAVSPKGDKLFMLVKETSGSAGYISNFDGTGMVRIMSSPLSQVNIEWPEDNTIALTTKGSASLAGYLYFVNPKSGVMRKVIGPMFGLSAKVSHDAKYVIYSASGSSNNLVTGLLAVNSGTSTDAVIRTLADKCAWGNFFKELVYCAMPSETVAATYPDDWYRGTITSTDKIWSLNATTGEIKLVTTIVDQSDRIVEAFNLGLDPRDDFLFFMNKKDLSLWAFDLNASN